MPVATPTSKAAFGGRDFVTSNIEGTIHTIVSSLRCDEAERSVNIGCMKIAHIDGWIACRCCYRHRLTKMIMHVIGVGQITHPILLLYYYHFLLVAKFLSHSQSHTNYEHRQPITAFNFRAHLYMLLHCVLNAVHPPQW